MELRLPLEMSPGREAACRAVFGTWGFFLNDARKNCPFVLTSFTGWSSERCPGIGFLSRGDRENGKYLGKYSRKFHRAKLESAACCNCLHSIYIVLGIVNNQE